MVAKLTSVYIEGISLFFFFLHLVLRPRYLDWQCLRYVCIYARGFAVLYIEFVLLTASILYV